MPFEWEIELDLDYKDYVGIDEKYFRPEENSDRSTATNSKTGEGTTGLDRTAARPFS